MSKRRILSNTVIYTISLLLPQIIGFFLLPVYTSYLSPSEYAVVSLVNTATNIASIFIALQLQSAIARYIIQYVAKKQFYKAKVFFTTNIIAMICFIIVGFALLEIFGNSLVNILYPNTDLNYSPYFRLSLLSVVFIAIYQAPLAIFKVLQKAKMFFVINAVVTFTSIVVTILLLVIGKLGIIGIFLGTMCGAMIGALVSFFLIREWFVFAFDGRLILKALKYSIPLIPHSLGTFLFTGANRIILERFVSLEQLGIFSLGSKIASVSLLLVSCFNMAYNPHFIEMAERNPESALQKNKEVIVYWYVLVLAMVLSFISYSNQILTVMSTEAYQGASGLLSILVFASIFRGLYMFAVSPFFFKKRTIYIPLITVLAGTVGLILNYILIPLFGLNGAAYATVASYFITFILAVLFSRNTFRILFPWRHIAQTSLLFFLFVGIYYWVNYFFYQSSEWIMILISLLLIILFCVCSIFIINGKKSFAYLSIVLRIKKD